MQQRNSWRVRGEAHGCARLNTEKVMEIRERYAATSLTAKQLAAEYGVYQATITEIVNGKIWQHLPLIPHSKNRKRMITLLGETMCVADWAREFDMDPGTIYKRLKRGLSGEDLFRKSWVR